MRLFFVFALIQLGLLSAQCPLTTPEFPFETQDEYWGNTYSWSAGLYLPSQVGGPTTINSLGFRVNAGSGTYTNVSIYLRHTNTTNYVSETGYPGHAGFTLVWQGTMTFTGTGVYNYTLTTPFVYNGSQNLEVLFEHRGGENHYPWEPWFHRTNAAPAGVSPGKVRSGSSWTNATAGSSNRVFNLALFVNGLAVDCVYNLPVDFLGAELICEPEQNRLDWSTASETNNNHFEILYSQDGIKWNFVNRVQGAGNSNQVQYYSNVFPGNISKGYVKLLQYDFDGTMEELGVYALNCKASELTIYPNPFESSFVIEGVSPVASFQLFDVMGKHIAFSYQRTNGLTEIFPATDVSGILFLSIEDEFGKRVQKIFSR